MPRIAFPELIAHRGAPNYAPENTLAGLKKARELGATWVEFDVMLSKDGVPVIMHDWTLNRTTNGRGPLRALTYAELARLDAGEGQVIPTLEQWLQAANTLGFGINIEIKEKAPFAEEIAQKVQAQLEDLWTAELPQPLISSATYACVQAYRARDPQAQLAYIVNGLPLFWRAKLAAIQASAIVINYKRLSVARVARLQQAGYQVLAYTVNKPGDLARLRNMGVDSCFTDDLRIT